MLSRFGCLGTIIILAAVYAVLVHFGLWVKFKVALMVIISFIGWGFLVIAVVIAIVWFVIVKFLI